MFIYLSNNPVNLSIFIDIFQNFLILERGDALRNHTRARLDIPMTANAGKCLCQPQPRREGLRVLNEPVGSVIMHALSSPPATANAGSNPTDEGGFAD